MGGDRGQHGPTPTPHAPHLEPYHSYEDSPVPKTALWLSTRSPCHLGRQRLLCSDVHGMGRVRSRVFTRLLASVSRLLGPLQAQATKLSCVHYFYYLRLVFRCCSHTQIYIGTLTMTYFTTGFQPVFVPRVGSGMGAPRLLTSDSPKNPVILASPIIIIHFLSVFNRIKTSGGPRVGSRTRGPSLVMPRLLMFREFSSPWTSLSSVPCSLVAIRRCGLS